MASTLDYVITLTLISLVVPLYSLYEPPLVPKCKYGKYFKDLEQNPTCNPLASQACPSGYSCSKTPNNQPGFCCKDTNPCLRGVPFHKNGDAINCMESGFTDCPSGYSCVGSSSTSMVCCKRGKYYGPPECPSDRPKQNCQVDLCKVRFCPSVPNAKCRMDVCGACTDRWFVGRTEVTKACKEGAPQSQCPKDKPFGFCFIPPCPGPNEPTKCPLFPEAKCYADQCGTCKARYFINLVEKTEYCGDYGR